MTDPYRIADLASLERLYGPPVRSARQETDHIPPKFRDFIHAAPFVILGTNGSNGLAASAKGDAGGFVKVLDEHTLLIPERGANGRNDSLRNIVVDPRVALTFLKPGEADMVRVSGQAHLSIDPALLEHFSTTGKLPRLVIVVHVQEAFCQCSRAIQAAKLWSSL